MAKYLLLSFGLLLFFNSYGKDGGLAAPCWQVPGSPRLKPDTISIEHDMAHQPFLLDTISLDAIKLLFGDGWVIKKQPIRNRFIKNQTDTLITIRKNKSYICLYAVSKAEKNFYKSAEILDPLPIFQKDIHVGQSKKEIQALFPELKGVSGIPDFVEIGAGEGTDYLYLVFEKGLLKKVEFKPYLD